MAFTATIQGSDIVVTEGDKILYRTPFEHSKDLFDRLLLKGDYVEISAVRFLRFAEGLPGLEEEDASGEAELRTSVPILDERKKWTALDRSGPIDSPFWKSRIGVRGSYRVSYGWHAYWRKTLDDLDHEFRVIKGQWDKSKECTTLVAQVQRLEKRVQVTNIVGLGIGSLHECFEKGIAERTGLQLAAALTIRDTLGGSTGPLTCVVQDPVYSTLEKDYLRSIGLEVVDDPDAFSRINAETLVINISTYFEMDWWIADGIWPAAMVTNDWENPRSLFVANYPSSYAAEVRCLFQGYEKETFISHDSDANGPWDRVQLFWRKSTDYLPTQSIIGQAN
ncbi:MAG: hypothetical protein M4579_001121 [Chaenotheca gracillima]|nr:MAG: hypothetical protein M4579_001121 [Chaenotheca gracillima]